MLSLRHLAFAAGALSLAAPAAAATIFTERTAFLAAVAATPGAAAPVDESFPAPIANAASITFASGVTSTGSGGTADNRVISGFFIGDIDTNNDNPDLFDAITFTFPDPIFAVGGDFSLAAGADGLLLTAAFDGGASMTVSIFDELGFPGTGFLGIVGTGPFTALTFTTGNLSNVNNEQFFLGNLVFAGRVAVDTPVPEPGALALLGLGALTLAFRRKQETRA